jgi:hypothetical protein
MKKAFLILIFPALMIQANAQTKKVAHQSHSGSAKTFNMTGSDNFGVVGPHEFTSPPPKKLNPIPKPKPKPKPKPMPAKQETPMAAPADSLKTSPNYPKGQQPKK